MEQITETTATAAELDAFNVWVSTYGLYNAGNLAGYWVDAAEAPEDIAEFVTGLRARGIRFDPRDVGEELHCFDTENAPVDGEMHPSEARALAEALADIDEDDRPAVIAWARNLHHKPTAEELAEVARTHDEWFAGWQDLEEWAGSYLEDSGMIAELPAWAQAYAGTLCESWARDAKLSGDVTEVEAADGRTFVAWNN
jgi:hypothetical protein